MSSNVATVHALLDAMSMILDKRQCEVFKLRQIDAQKIAQHHEQMMRHFEPLIALGQKFASLRREMLEKLSAQNYSESSLCATMMKKPFFDRCEVHDIVSRFLINQKIDDRPHSDAYFRYNYSDRITVQLFEQLIDVTFADDFKELILQFKKAHSEYLKMKQHLNNTAPQAPETGSLIEYTMRLKPTVNIVCEPVNVNKLAEKLTWRIVDPLASEKTFEFSFDEIKHLFITSDIATHRYIAPGDTSIETVDINHDKIATEESLIHATAEFATQLLGMIRHLEKKISNQEKRISVLEQDMYQITCSITARSLMFI